MARLLTALVVAIVVFMYLSFLDQKAVCNRNSYLAAAQPYARIICLVLRGRNSPNRGLVNEHPAANVRSVIGGTRNLCLFGSARFA